MPVACKGRAPPQCFHCSGCFVDTAVPTGCCSVQQHTHELVLLLQASPGALDLLQRLMAFDPDQRITAAEALAHPYFSTTPAPTPPAQLPKPAATRYAQHPTHLGSVMHLQLACQHMFLYCQSTPA
jgi:serine/threonine protein kinase